MQLRNFLQGLDRFESQLIAVHAGGAFPAHIVQHAATFVGRPIRTSMTHAPVPNRERLVQSLRVLAARPADLYSAAD